MFLRELDGYYAGQIREFPSDVGLALLAAGRAEDPYAEPAPAAEAQPQPLQPPPAAKRRKLK
ncbi:MAG TPA: hypothetical protein VM554_12895 [Acidisarcina sp.]|nr:hypothetical protein [Acidisarcina sp.]